MIADPPTPRDQSQPEANGDGTLALEVVNTYFSDLERHIGMVANMALETGEDADIALYWLLERLVESSVDVGTLQTDMGYLEAIDEVEKELGYLRRRFMVFAKNGYSFYLRTEHWSKMRAAALERAGNCCQLCNSTKRLETHHRTYERLWDERPDDLIVLCRDCHAKFHGKMP